MERQDIRTSRRPAVEAKTGLSRSQIYALMARGDFPKPIKLGPRSVAWIESEINDWIIERIEQSRANSKA